VKPIELKNDLFCSRVDFCDAAISNGCEELSCGECHRKWPTPEQFQEEYGENYPLNGAVYALFEDYWKPTSLFEATHPMRGKLIIVCACTPFGKPDEEWRPE